MQYLDVYLMCLAYIFSEVKLKRERSDISTTRSEPREAVPKLIRVVKSQRWFMLSVISELQTVHLAAKCGVRFSFNAYEFRERHEFTEA